MDATLQGRAGIRRLSVANDGDSVPFRTMRDGAQVYIDWVRMLSLEGRVFQSHMGTLDTPIVPQLAFDVTLPSMTVDVPPNIVAIPLFFEIWAVVTTAPFHVHFSTATVRTMNTSAFAGTLITPLNWRLGSTRVPACRSAHTVTVTGGDPTTGARYLTHRGNQGDIDAIAIDGCYKWSLYDCPIVPIIDAGGSINAYFYDNNAANRVFAKITWAELDIEDIRLPQN